jgi:hypothetical protein
MADHSSHRSAYGGSDTYLLILDGKNHKGCGYSLSKINTKMEEEI